MIRNVGKAIHTHLQAHVHLLNVEATERLPSLAWLNQLLLKWHEATFLLALLLVHIIYIYITLVGGMFKVKTLLCAVLVPSTQYNLGA